VLAQTLALYTKEKYENIWLLLFGAMYCMSGLVVWLVGTQVFWAEGFAKDTRPRGHTKELQGINSKFENGKGNTKGESENSSEPEL
jgi:hypothetical protein